MCGSSQEHHKTPFFSSKSHIPGNIKSYSTCYCEGPDEQPGMTLVLPLTYERALYHKAVHPLACLLNALQYQLNENFKRPVAAALYALISYTRSESEMFIFRGNGLGR